MSTVNCIDLLVKFVFGERIEARQIEVPGKLGHGKLGRYCMKIPSQRHRIQPLVTVQLQLAKESQGEKDDDILIYFSTFCHSNSAHALTLRQQAGRDFHIIGLSSKVLSLNSKC